MGTTRRWTAEILLDEDDLGTTRAAVRLDTSEDEHLHGLATWQDPDTEAPCEIGDEVAVAEALSQIAAKLRQHAADAVGSGVGSGAPRGAWRCRPVPHPYS
jgi:hypothetical protein